MSPRCHRPARRYMTRSTRSPMLKFGIACLLKSTLPFPTPGRSSLQDQHFDFGSPLYRVFCRGQPLIEFHLMKLSRVPCVLTRCTRAVHARIACGFSSCAFSEWNLRSCEPFINAGHIGTRPSGAAPAAWSDANRAFGLAAAHR
jgi:hypothetical protein